MKKSLLLFSLLTGLSLSINAQAADTTAAAPSSPKSASTAKNFRVSTHSGYGLSWADLQRNGNTLNDVVRFTVVINLGVDAQWQGEKCGLSLGLETRNLGVIYDDTLNGPNQSVRVKSRVYTLGAPVTFMIGNMREKTYFFIGGEYEYTFDYKEKVFVDDLKGKKDYKTKSGYSETVNKWLPSLHAGIQVKSGTYIKFQYYMTDFFSDKYQFKYNLNNGPSNPYPAFNKSQLYYLEFGHRLFVDQPSSSSSKSSMYRSNLRKQMARL